MRLPLTVFLIHGINGKGLPISILVVCFRVERATDCWRFTAPSCWESWVLEFCWDCVKLQLLPTNLLHHKNGRFTATILAGLAHPAFLSIQWCRKNVDRYTLMLSRDICQTIEEPLSFLFHIEPVLPAYASYNYLDNPTIWLKCYMGCH